MSHRIAVIPGDGIGVEQAVHQLRNLTEHHFAPAYHRAAASLGQSPERPARKNSVCHGSGSSSLMRGMVHAEVVGAAALELLDHVSAADL